MAGAAPIPADARRVEMLALWVSKAYSEGYRGDHRDPLIGLGTAPLDDSIFRTAVFEQLGESKLEGAVTTDICGKKIPTRRGWTRRRRPTSKRHGCTAR